MKKLSMIVLLVFIVLFGVNNFASASVTLTYKEQRIFNQAVKYLDGLYTSNFEKFITIHNRLDAAAERIPTSHKNYSLIYKLEEYTSDKIEDGKESESKTTSDEYFVSQVIDGDTIVVKNIEGIEKKVRLIGIDAPESTALRFGKTEVYGAEATRYLKSLLKVRSKVRLEYDSSQGNKDSHGRELAYVFFGSENINKKMIEDGYALEYTYDKPYKYSSSFKKAEENAKKMKKNLWGIKAQNQIKEEKIEDQKKQEQVGECNIKGNINSKGKKLYHLPSCPSYSRTKISTYKGEKYFCSTAQAESEGWVIAGNCH